MSKIVFIVVMLLPRLVSASEQPIPQSGESVEDFIARYGQWEEQVPFEDRSVFKMLEIDELINDSLEDTSLLTADPESPGWQATKNFLNTHPEVIDQIQEYAELPFLGIPAQYMVWEQDSDDSWLGLTGEDFLYPHLQFIRTHTILLAAQAKMQLNNGSIDEALATLAALNKINTHIANVHMPFEYLVEFASNTTGIFTVFDGEFDLQSLNREQLLQLRALYIESPQKINVDMVINFKEWSSEAFLRYIYKGAIAGKIPSRGYDRLLNYIERHNGKYAAALDGVSKSNAQKTVRSFEDQVNLLSDFMNGVRRDFDTSESDLKFFQHESVLNEHLGTSVSTALPYVPVALSLSDFELLYNSRFIFRSYRSSVDLLIALHLHRLEHGAFPLNYNEIDTDSFGIEPIDYLTGNKLPFIIENGNIIVYSYGWDRDDDKGRIINNEDILHDGRIDFLTHDEYDAMETSEKKKFDGDMQLYPLVSN